MANSLVAVTTPYFLQNQTPLLDDGGLGWVEDAIALALAAIQGGVGKSTSKENYKRADAAAIKLIDTYGVDIGTLSKSFGVDPNQVVQALSEYLASDFKITLAPSKIIADQNTKYPQTSQFNQNLTPILLGGGCLLLLFLLTKKK